jgi:hypothetical protein
MFNFFTVIWKKFINRLISLFLTFTANKLKDSIDGLNKNLPNYCGGKGKNGFDFGVAIMDKIDVPQK